MSLARFSIRNPVLINLIMLTILVVGVYSYISLPRELAPEIPFNWVFIITVYPGASPEEIEQFITKPIEEEIEDVEKIDLITSTSSESASVISVKFEQNISEREFDKRFQDLSTAVDKAVLPDAAEDPEVTELSTSVWMPMINVVISGSLPEHQLKDIAEELEGLIKQAEGVSKITIAGIRDREIWVEVDPDRMDSLNLTFPQIVSALSAQNVNVPGGNVRSGRSEYILRTLGQFQDGEEIKNVIVHTYPSANQLRVRDVASVRDTFEEAETLARFNGRQAVTLSVAKKAGSNTIAMSKQVKEIVKEYEASKLPDGAYLDITSDMAVFIKDSLGTLQRNAFLGVILVLLSLAIFLGARNGMFVAIGMPVTFTATFIFMKITGQTINGNSLFGLVLVLGMVVDHAIVITENIYRHAHMKKSMYQAAVDGMAEVTTPVLSATATTIAAFLPLMLMPGIVGAFMKTIPMVVTVALLASLFEALVILPSHIAEWSRPGNRKKNGRWCKKIVDKLLRSRRAESDHPAKKHNGNGRFLKKALKVYSRILKHILRRRYWAVGGVLLCVIAGVGLIPLIGVDMFGSEDVGSFFVRVWMPAGTRLSETDRVLKQIEDIALTLPENELKGVMTNVGILQENDSETHNTHVGQLVIELVDADERDRSVFDIIADLRARCQNIGGPERMEFANWAGGPPTGKDVEVKVKGKHFGQLEAITEELKTELARIPGVYDIGDDFSQGKEELRIRLDEDRARLHGLSVAQVAGFVRTAFHGAIATVYRDGDEEVDVVVKLRNASEMSLEEIEAMKLATPMGTIIPLRDVARLELTRGYAIVHRFGVERAITVSAEVDRSLNKPVAVNRIVEKKFKDISQLYPGYRLDFRGQFTEFNEAFASLSRLLIFGVFIIYMLLGAQFKSFVQPLIIMFAIPFAFIGSMIGLLVIGHPFGILTLYGMVALAGIVVNDSIVLIDFINVRRRAGVNKWRAIIEGGRLRLRPIALTTITTVFGLLPMAIGLGGNSETWMPLANTIIWGLSMSTLLTLFITPALYAIVDDLTPRRLKEKQMEALRDTRIPQPEPAD